jgi:hypothetical protein
MLPQWPKGTKQRIATAVAPNAKCWFLLLLANDYANTVAASELAFQKPVIGNSSSAFCSHSGRVLLDERFQFGPQIDR